MATRPPAISSIAMALAGKTPSMDIPKPRDYRHPAGRDGAVHDQQDSRRGLPVLPTPPSSISPALHPHGFKHRAAGNLPPDSPTSAPAHVDSDIDLHDSKSLEIRRLHHYQSQQKPSLPLVAETLDNLDGLESAGAISPAMLAKYHLPDILLDHGPLAIRHIMGYLTTTVPGFSGIPPAKARRLVVAALEGKGTSGDGAGINGDVHFEKVGWGRWDAKRRGSGAGSHQNAGPPQPSSTSLLVPKNQVVGGHASPPSSLASPSYLPQLMMPGRHESARYGSSMTADSAVFSHSEFGAFSHPDPSMLEHEADKMSLDGEERAYCSSSEEASDNDVLMDGDWDEADITDEEDWAQIGAAALRARSFPNNAPTNHMYPKWRNHGSGGGPSYSTLAKAVPGQISIQHPAFSSFPDGVGGNVEERAAVEALLQLGSM